MQVCRRVGHTEQGGAIRVCRGLGTEVGEEIYRGVGVGTQDREGHTGFVWGLGIQGRETPSRCAEKLGTHGIGAYWCAGELGTQDRKLTYRCVWGGWAHRLGRGHTGV